MQKKFSIWQELKAMEFGEEKIFPPEKLRSVRTVASDVGFSTGRKYSVKKDSANRQVIVKRTE